MAVHRDARRFSEFGAEAERQQVTELVERYGNQWIATARRNCSNAADAEDAFQRAVETLLTNPPAETDPERIAAWMHTVVRNEALQIVRSQKREVDTEFEVIAGGLAADTAIPDESVVDAEGHGMAKEALRRLRPDQTRCLLLRADGFDYPEICRITGFSYAKVNRLLSEGRKAARVRVDSITEGRECERVEPLISMFVDGVADAEVARDVQMHIDHCSHCQATVRDYALAPKDLAAAMPLGLLSVASNLQSRFTDPLHRIAEFFGARSAGGSGDASLAVAKKVLAVIAVGAAAVGGGAAIKHAEGGNDSAASRPAPAATAPSSLLTPIPYSSRDAARRRANARSAREADEARAVRAATGALDDPAVADTAPPRDVAADQDQGVAADPADAGGGNGTNDVGGLAP